MKISQKVFKILFGILLFIAIPQVGTTQTIDTVENYVGLKLYSGDSDTVFINHERYHGFFQKDTCTIEDFGTKILGVSTCWKRIHSNFSPRYWSINGPSPDPIIASVKNEVDAINSAAFAAFQSGGDTILIDSIYIIDRPVFLLTNNTFLGTSDSSGFARIHPPKTILTDTAKINDNRILVESNLGFKTYQKINIANDIQYDSLAGYVSYTASVSNQLGGDTIIFLSGLKIQKEMYPGDSVSLFFPMMRPRFTSIDSIYLKNLVFIGNKKHYNLNYDWRVNTTIILYTTNISLIEQCRFYDIPSENIFLCGTNIMNCSGVNLNGSALHFSCNSFDHPMEILYNNFLNTNIIGNDIMDHSEAGFTFSAKVQNLRLAYNTLQNTGAHGVGIFKNDDSSNEITDNLLDTDMETISFLYPFYDQYETNIIYNNKNLNYADSSAGNCWKYFPLIMEPLSCSGNSSFQNPLDIGDTVEVVFDSILVKSTNENFIKTITPLFDNSFFDLASIDIQVEGMSSFHNWVIDSISTSSKALVFDNGHKDGLFGLGNWGNELCSYDGGCTHLNIQFVVRELPDSTTLTDCPLMGIQVQYDGESGTWTYPITCENEPYFFDQDNLGRPILKGTGPISNLITFPNQRFELNIYPNPTSDFIHLDLPFKSSFEYTISDLFGKKIINGYGIENDIPVSTLGAGMYSLKISVKEKYYYEVFVKN